MRIGVLGTGTMADALGTQWARAGHELFIGAARGRRRRRWPPGSATARGRGVCARPPDSVR
ncbi:hypothetical protein SSPO_076410 [Streptomyces antimycoticus]|uniref:Pyrroline-5-carboxylate reductase catalytic N-terminal domain-containing protein n=1 Tax=Streptomyces antimycoticus TaxID=68175 RepID=A0A499USG7_9ACTN|nr:hypothetical protein SSPO_076410 [Streptomyces antimycoticus]